MLINLLLFNLAIFILVAFFTILLMQIKDAKVKAVEYWFIAATPVINVALLLIVMYEFIISIIGWRER